MSQSSGSLYRPVWFMSVLLFLGIAVYAGFDHIVEFTFPANTETVEESQFAVQPAQATASDRSDRVPSEQITRESQARTTADGRVVRPLERRHNELLVAFLDVGQGDSIFLQFPDGTNMIIDVGDGNYRRLGKRIDASNTVILPFLEQNNIKRIDYFIESHPHADHIGAASDLTYQLAPEQAILSGRTHTTVSYEMMLEAFDNRNVPVDGPTESGGTLDVGDNIPLPDVDFVLKRSDPENENINEASLTFRLQYGDVSFLFTGDTERGGERELLDEWRQNLDSTVLKVGHHGSRTSSTEDFIRTVSPEHAVIMVGGYNSYGHPTDAVVSRLQQHGAELHRTDEHGTIIMTTDGEQLRYHHASGLTAVP